MINKRYEELSIGAGLMFFAFILCWAGYPILGVLPAFAAAPYLAGLMR